MKAWEAAFNAYRAVLAKQLEDAGVVSISTPYGTPVLKRRTDRRGRPDRVDEVVQRYELAREQVQAIWMCASALDVKRLLALADAGAIPQDAASALIEVKTTSWVQVTPSRPEPPTVQRMQVEATGQGNP